MKNLIVLLFVAGLLLMSCNEEENSNEMITMEQLKREMAELPELEVQIITLEEYNALRIEHNLKPVHRILKSSHCTPGTCNNAANYGDYNGDGILSGLDLILWMIFIEDHDTNDDDALGVQELQDYYVATLDSGPLYASWITALGMNLNESDIEGIECQILGQC